jgi:hypothetical protein
MLAYSQSKCPIHSLKLSKISYQNSGRVGGFKKISSSKGLETKSKKLLFISLEGDHK